MGKNHDRMRAAAGKKPPPAAAPAKPKEPVAMLAFRCGHTDTLANFTNADCPCCKRAKKQKKNAAKKAAKAAAAVEQPARDRLPAGSSFICVWDGKQWTGTLGILDAEMIGPRSASGVKPLLRVMSLLDDDYRSVMGQPASAAQEQAG